MPTKNQGRMAQDMKRELIAIIGEMKDPRVMGREGGSKPVVAALNKASGHVRTEVSRRMHIRKAPRFVFVTDDGAAYAAHINEMLRGLEKDSPAAQAEPQEE